MRFAIHEPTVLIDKSLVVFPFSKKLIVRDDVYDVVFPYSMFSHVITPFLFVSAVKPEVTRTTDLWIFGAAMKILLHDFMHRIIEYRHCALHS